MTIVCHSLRFSFGLLLVGLQCIFALSGCTSTPSTKSPISQGTTESEALAQQASLFLRTGELRKAIRKLDRAIEISPGNSRLYNDRGWAFEHLDDSRMSQTRAIQDFTKAIELDVNYAQAYYNRGCAYAALGQCDSALSDLASGLSLSADEKLRADIFEKRARVYTQLNRPDEAVADGQQSVQLVPSNVDARITLACALADRGSVDDALRQLDEAALLAPNDIAVYADRAIIDYNANRFDHARRDVELFLKAGGSANAPFVQKLQSH